MNEHPSLEELSERKNEWNFTMKESKGDEEIYIPFYHSINTFTYTHTHTHTRL